MKSKTPGKLWRNPRLIGLLGILLAPAQRLQFTLKSSRLPIPTRFALLASLGVELSGTFSEKVLAFAFS